MKDKSTVPDNPGFDSILAALIEADEQAKDQPVDIAKWTDKYPQHAAQIRSYFGNRGKLEEVLGPRAAVDAEAPTIGIDSQPDESTRRIRYFGDYELLNEIARGGMGVVFKARQVSLNRVVAVKMILAGNLAGPNDVQRFHAEAEAAANLDHPHIVPIYEVGEHEGQHYFSMKLIEGKSLSLAKDSRPKTETPKEKQRWAGSLVAQVARAVHHAHQRGILHRDLKPGNILIDHNGEPHVTDFGLAKKVEGGSDLTNTGAIVGTPAYMAPEQARSEKGLSTAVDVYSLGAILYELLIGRPPFKADSPLDTILEVMEKEPARPSSIVQSVDRDLETITLKCLEKEPGRRFGSAEALAEELERWQRGEPITIRPVGQWERGWRWCRRNRALAASLLGIAAILLVATTVAITLALWAFENEDNAINKTNEAVAQKQRADDQAKVAIKERNAAEHLLATQANIEGFRLLKAGEYFSGMLWLSEPFIRAQNQPDIMHTTRLRLAAYRTFANPGVRLQNIIGHERAVNLAGFCNNSNHVFSIERFSRLNIWDLSSEKSLPVSDKIETGLDRFFSRRMTKFAITSRFTGDNTIQVFDVYNGNPLTDKMQHNQRILRALFSPDDRFLVTTSTDKIVRIWSIQKETKLFLQYHHSAEIAHIVFSHDSRFLATVSEQGAVQLWDVLQGKQKLASMQILAVDAAFSPDARCLSLATFDQVSRNWEVACYDVLSEQLAFAKFATNRFGISGIVYSPDGMHILTTSNDSKARLWDASNGKLLTEFSANDSFIMGKFSPDDITTTVIFSPDGRWVIASCSDNSVRIWNALTGKLATAPLKHNGTISHVAFESKGTRIITASEDGTVRVWAMTSNQQPFTSLPHEDRVQYVTFSPDGKKVLTASEDKTARLWDSSTGKTQMPYLQHDTAVHYAAFSNDGKKLVTACGDFTARIWDATSCQPLTRPLHHVTGVKGFDRLSASLSNDGRRLITTSGSYSNVVIWDTSSGQIVTKSISPDRPTIQKDRYAPVGTKPAYPREEEERRIKNIAQLSDQTDVRYAEFSQDGMMILTASENKHARVWDALSGKPISPPLMHEHRANQAQFSPDSRYVVTVENNNAQAWDARSGERLAPTMNHDDDVSQLCFSPDSSSLATVSMVSARVWDLKTGKPITPSMRHNDSVRNVSFSRDGRFVATSSADASARVWESSTGQPVTPPLLHESFVNHVMFHPLTNKIVTASWDRSARIWELTFDERAEKDLIQFARVYASSKIDETGSLQSLNPKTELIPWFQELKAKYPADFSVTPEQARRWRLQQIRECCKESNLPAALFHQNWLLAEAVLEATKAKQ